ncbi:hypothetical protein FQR65_LT04388 [Abscondita terminalis]|nr:hypothetical protein FQR65_LT04388 [Abscondita terminalis]
MLYLKSVIVLLLVSIFVEVPAHKNDIRLQKKSPCAITFNPIYTAEQIIDEYILCLNDNPEALKLQLEVSEKHNCTGSLKDKILCGIHNRDNLDESDYDKIAKVYVILPPECINKLIIDDGGLTGRERIKELYRCLGEALNI